MGTGSRSAVSTQSATNSEGLLDERGTSETLLAAEVIDPQMHSLGGMSQCDDTLSLAEAGALVDVERPGRFRFKKRLGKGAMGTVFLVYDSNVDIDVAIKLVPGDPRAMREGRAMGRLKDQRIVTLLDMFQCGKYVALVMEYVNGSTLDAAFESGEVQRDFTTLLRIAKEVAGALACLHTASVPVVHRDLKGANVLISKTGAIRVLDFGLGVMCAQPSVGPETSARSLSADGCNTTFSAAGTPTTMAPEQAFAPREVGTYSDIFAFGAMFYDFATGSPPHNGATVNEVLRKKRSPVAPLASLRPDLSERFCALIDGCLTIEWQYRLPRDGALLYDALLALEFETAHAAERVSHGLTSDRPPARPSTRRSMGTAALIGMALAMFGVTATLGVGQQHRASAGRAMAARAAAAEAQVIVRSEGAPVPTPDRVAVLGFSNQTKNPALDADGAMLAERIAAAIELDGPLVLHRNDAVRGQIERKITDARSRKDAASLAALAATGVRYALLGTLGGDPSRVNARLELVDMTTALSVASIDASAPEHRLFELMDGVDREVRQLLSLRVLEAEGVTAIRRVLPEDTEAARTYARALEVLGRGELRAARDQLVAIGAGGARSHARTHLLVAEINHQLGADDDAKLYAESARLLARGLPERERLPVEARADLAAGDAAPALAKLKTLGRTRRDVESTVRLVEAAYEADKYDDGKAAIRELELFGDAFARDPHIVRMKAALAWKLGDVANTLVHAREAAALAGERIALRAQAKRFEARALLISVGATAEAIATREEALNLLLAIDDRRDAATLYITSGDAKYNAMDFSGAINDYNAGLRVNGDGASSIADNLFERIVSAEWKLRHYAEAERLFQTLISRKNVDDFARGYAYLLAAAGAREQGHLEEAAKRLASAREYLKGKSADDLMFTIIEEAALERARGHTSAALRLARRAFHLASTDAQAFKSEAANALGWAHLAGRNIKEAAEMFTLAHSEARMQNSRIDEDEACKGIEKIPLQEVKVICAK